MSLNLCFELPILLYRFAKFSPDFGGQLQRWRNTLSVLAATRAARIQANREREKKKERVDWRVPAISLLFSSITCPSVLSLLRSQRYRRLKGTDLSQSYCLVKAELWPAAMKVTAGAATSAPPRGSVPEGSESRALEYLYLALGILMAPTLFLAQGQDLECFSARLGTLNAKTQAH